MTLVGFEKYRDGEIREYLPANEQMKNTHEQRQMFMHLYNAYADEDLRFTREEMACGKDLYEIFRNKIAKMLFTSSLLPFNTSIRLVKIYPAASRMIGLFIRESYANRTVKPDAPLTQIIKMIRLVYAPDRCGMLCDLDDMFLHLVYERAKLVNRKNKVLLFDKSIVIQDHRENVSSTLLIPTYRKIDKKRIYDDPVISSHMQTVVNTLKETEIRQIYLVYPKHPEFKKYLTIKLLGEVPLKENEYRVKVIPYSFSFCTRKQKKTTFTRRQKCQ